MLCCRTPEDLTAIGIKKPHHRKKLKAEIDSLELGDWLPQQFPRTVQQLMLALRLDQYLPALSAQGYNTVQDILAISIEDLEDIGFYQLGHQKRLLLGIKRVRELRAQAGQHLSIVEPSPLLQYQPQQMRMVSAAGPAPPRPVRQSFSSFSSVGGGPPTGSAPLQFPAHPNQPAHPANSVCGDSEPPGLLEMPQPMEPLSHAVYNELTQPVYQAWPTPQPPQQPHTDVWPRQPAGLEQVGGGGGGGGGTLTRHRQLPTATVKPLTSTESGWPPPPSQEEVCTSHEGPAPHDNNLPFANERAGTIRLKNSPQEAFAGFLQEEEASDQTKDDSEAGVNKSLLRTPTRAANRTAGDVMDDISSMLADLTDELDSMLCFEK